ncbi:glioma pathogenesis-related protein 1-like [Crassostrea virginica]|uniref:Glioma pathogenesis-related protein 1-like n=1 Tax=Crassostrea virginica TaxID=6565 RepID=A0A8B8E6V5_CRAVI|nr:glioma pathogenesis-related protein 1-like [Crassostrea virginica]
MLSFVVAVASILLQFSLNVWAEIDASAMVTAHNMFRRNVEPTASNMVELQWNANLAEMADRWSRRCQFAHNNGRNNQSIFSSVGENLAYSSDDRKADSYVQMWFDEVKDYVFETNTCSAVCGHYTQVVWATTEYVGCGKTYCSNLGGFLVVCNYAPAGNYPTQPYRNCQPCSRCPEGYTCSDRLCRPP